MILEKVEGDRVPTAFTRIVLRGNYLQRTLYVLTPTQPLEAFASYQVRVTAKTRDWSSCFTTGEGPDVHPPQLPRERLRDTDSARGSSCGTFTNVRLKHEIDEPDSEVLIAKLDAFDDLSVTSWSGTAHDVSYQGEFGGGDAYIEYGTGPWAGWSGQTSTASESFGAFDLAGNFSGWSPRSSNPIVFSVIENAAACECEEPDRVPVTREPGAPVPCVQSWKRSAQQTDAGIPRGLCGRLVISGVGCAQHRDSVVHG